LIGDFFEEVQNHHLAGLKARALAAGRRGGDSRIQCPDELGVGQQLQVLTHHRRQVDVGCFQHLINRCIEDPRKRRLRAPTYPDSSSSDVRAIGPELCEANGV